MRTLNASISPGVAARTVALPSCFIHCVAYMLVISSTVGNGEHRGHCSYAERQYQHGERRISRRTPKLPEAKTRILAEIAQ